MEAVGRAETLVPYPPTYKTSLPLAITISVYNIKYVHNLYHKKAFRPGATVCTLHVSADCSHLRGICTIFGSYCRYSLGPFDVRGVVALHAPHTLVPQFAHVHLQGEQREDHEAKDGKRHHFS